MKNQKIGFVGLGIMGIPMCRNLVKAGYELTVYDIRTEAVREAEAFGAKAAVNPGDAAKGNPVVITMLPNSPHVKTAVLGENGILEGTEPGAILIDMSSVSPLASKEISRDCEKKGVKMLDAPVSGGEPKAVDGTLSIMVGGEREIFDEVRDILLCMGSSAVYCGGAGAGNTTKLANQVVVALNIAACAEAFTLAKASGVDPGLVFDAVRGR